MTTEATLATRRGPENLLPASYNSPILPTNDFSRAGTSPNSFNSRDFRYTREEVIALQRNMKALGYDIGNFGPNRDGVDGDPGRLFHRGLMRFAQEHGNLRFTSKADLGATMSAVVRANAPEEAATPSRTTPSARVMPTSQIDERAFAQARELLIRREGRRNVAYYDSEGYLTVGIGHRVLPSDNIRPGQRISDERIEQLFRQDMNRSFRAAQTQARQANCYTPDMLCALTSVNFQLGTDWNRDFRRAWSALRRGDFSGAVEEIYDSLWASQTPTRVRDFANAIQGHARSLVDRGRDLINGAVDMGRDLWEGGRNLLEQSPLGRLFSANAEPGYRPAAAQTIQLASNAQPRPGFMEGLY